MKNASGKAVERVFIVVNGTDLGGTKTLSIEGVYSTKTKARSRLQQVRLLNDQDRRSWRRYGVEVGDDQQILEFELDTVRLKPLIRYSNPKSVEAFWEEDTNEHTASV